MSDVEGLRAFVVAKPLETFPLEEQLEKYGVTIVGATKSAAGVMRAMRRDVLSPETVDFVAIGDHRHGIGNGGWPAQEALLFWDYAHPDLMQGGKRLAPNVSGEHCVLVGATADFNLAKRIGNLGLHGHPLALNLSDIEAEIGYGIPALLPEIARLRGI